MMTRRSALSGAAALTLVAGGVGVASRAAAREAGWVGAYPPEGTVLDVDGVATHAVIAGEGPDLVLIHGASASAREWTFRLMAALSPRYRCIAFDRPGLGHSGHLRPAHGRAFASASASPAEQAAHLARAHAQVGRGLPIVAGHSYGGATALAWGLDHPARALVPLAAPSLEWPGDLGWITALAGSALGGGLVIPVVTATIGLDRMRGMAEGVFAPEAVPEGYFAHVGNALTLRRDSLRTNARQVQALKRHVVAMSARYGELTLPIELVHGLADGIVPARVHSIPLAERWPDAALETIPGAGHMIHQTHPDRIVAAIDRAAARSEG